MGAETEPSRQTVTYLESQDFHSLSPQEFKAAFEKQMAFCKSLDIKQRPEAWTRAHLELEQYLLHLRKDKAVEPLMTHFLAVVEGVWGKEHIYTGTAEKNLGLCYFLTEQPKKAEPHLQRALEIYRSALGEEHPVVADRLMNMSMVYLTLARYEEALSMAKSALAIQRKVYGEESRETVGTLLSMATLHQLMLQTEEAEVCYLRALDIQEAILGSEDPSLESALGNLATLYLEGGQLEKAEVMMRRLLILKTRYSGTDEADEHDNPDYRKLYAGLLVKQGHSKQEAEAATDEIVKQVQADNADEKRREVGEEPQE